MLKDEPQNTRLHAIDWLRTISILLLFPFHVVDYFSDSAFRLKTGIVIPSFNYTYHFFEQWRLCLLFFISGTCSYIYLNKYNKKKYALSKFKRISIPLTLGCIIFIAPQVYVEKLRYGNDFKHYSEFILNFFDGIYPKGNLSWGHLWFLFYLQVYMYLYLLFYERLKKLQLSPFVLLLPIVIEVFISPLFVNFRNFFTDWGNVCLFGFYFYLGTFYPRDKVFTFIKPSFLYPTALFFLVATPLLNSTHPLHHLFMGLRTLLIILFLLELSQKYLNFTNRFLNYFQKANYPIYIIHHTAIILIAEYFLDTDPYLFLFIVLVLSIISTFFFYEVSRRFWIGRKVLGMK